MYKIDAVCTVKEVDAQFSFDVWSGAGVRAGAWVREGLDAGGRVVMGLGVVGR